MQALRNSPGKSCHYERWKECTRYTRVQTWPKTYHLFEHVWTFGKSSLLREPHHVKAEFSNRCVDAENDYQVQETFLSESCGIKSMVSVFWYIDIYSHIQSNLGSMGPIIWLWCLMESWNPKIETTTSATISLVNAEETASKILDEWKSTTQPPDSWKVTKVCVTTTWHPSWISDIRRKAAVQQWFQGILDLGNSAMCATIQKNWPGQYQELLECEKPSNSSSSVTATFFERQQCRWIQCSVNCRPLRCLWFWDQCHLLIKNAAVLQPNS